MINVENVINRINPVNVIQFERVSDITNAPAV